MPLKRNHIADRSCGTGIATLDTSPASAGRTGPESVRTMKKLLGFAILALCLSIPAHAQRSMTGGGTGQISNGGGGFGGSPIAGGGTVSFHTLPAVPRTQFQIVDISGGDVSFFPSSFVQFDEGIAEGEAALAAKHKTLAEVALENRAAEKPKAKVRFTQDNFGDVILERE